MDQLQLKTFTDQKKYELVSKIAEGGMGVIYRANQLGVEKFSKDVALKVIRSGISSDSEFVRLFIGEAKLVADLVHENIVQVYHLGKTDDQYFIALEYVDGIDLGKFIEVHQERSLELEADLGAFIISRICRGLEYAHNKSDRRGRHLSIVHRDVSPRNIMINYEGVVKLTDFGIAKAAQVMEQREGEFLMGKAAFMSPEQAGGKETDGRSDLFSLGVVMYELLTGHQLFVDQNLKGTLKNVMDLPIPDPREYRPDLPEEVVDILMKALQRPQEQRFQTAGAMGETLERYMYHDRYGPTNVTLGNYMKQVFLGIDDPQPGGDPQSKATDMRQKIGQGGEATVKVGTTRKPRFRLGLTSILRGWYR